MHTTTPTETPQEIRVTGHMPVLAGLLLTSLLLGLTWRHWMEGKQGVPQPAPAGLYGGGGPQHLQHPRPDGDAGDDAARGVKGYYGGSESIDREEFKAYVAALALEDTLPGLQAVAYVSRLAPDQRQAHEQEIRSQGFGRYTSSLRGAGLFCSDQLHRAAHRPQPESAGFRHQHGSCGSRCTGAARDTGEAALSAALTLQQDAGRNDSVATVMYLPIYAKPHDPETVDGRRTALLGWVSAPIRIEELLHGMARQLDSDIGLRISDLDAPSDRAALWQPGGRGIRPAGIPAPGGRWPHMAAFHARLAAFRATF